MQTSSLSSIMNTNRQAPYTKSVKVNVVVRTEPKSYINDRNETRQYITAGIADSTRAAKLVVYDHQKFGRVREGESLVLRNFIVKPDETLIATTLTKIFATEDIAIDDETRQQAVELVMPKPAEVQPLKEALESPVKKKISIKGRVVQEDVTHEVQVKNQPVNIKHIYLQDKTVERCRISLWREHADANIKSGDFVFITDVVINNFKNETSLSTTSMTKITKCSAPDEDIVYHVEGAAIDGENVTYLLASDDIITVPLKIVQASCPGQDISEFEFHGNKTFILHYTGDEIASMEFI